MGPAARQHACQVSRPGLALIFEALSIVQCLNCVPSCSGLTIALQRMQCISAALQCSLLSWRRDGLPCMYCNTVSHAVPLCTMQGLWLPVDSWLQPAQTPTLGQSLVVPAVSIRVTHVPGHKLCCSRVCSFVLYVTHIAFRTRAVMQAHPWQHATCAITETFEADLCKHAVQMRLSSGVVDCQRPHPTPSSGLVPAARPQQCQAAPAVPPACPQPQARATR